MSETGESGRASDKIGTLELVRRSRWVFYGLVFMVGAAAVHVALNSAAPKPLSTVLLGVFVGGFLGIVFIWGQKDLPGCPLDSMYRTRRGFYVVPPRIMVYVMLTLSGGFLAASLALSAFVWLDIIRAVIVWLVFSALGFLSAAFWRRRCRRIAQNSED